MGAVNRADNLQECFIAILRPPANVMSLDALFLESPIPAVRQQTIISHLWGIRHAYEKQPLRPYFQYYTEQCRTARQSQGSGLAIQTHEHIIELVARIQKGDSRSEVKEFIQRRQWTCDPPSDNAIDASIDLAVRLSYMIDVGEFERAYSGRQRLLWTDGILQDFLREAFPVALSHENDRTKLDEKFTICNMILIAGFQVEPTSNLYNHLQLRDKIVEVFHHASFLVAHRQYV